MKDYDTFDFYLKAPQEPMIDGYKMYRGTMAGFKRVETLYESLYATVIDKQLGVLDPGKEVYAEDLTDDPILRNWENGYITAVDIDTKDEFFYLEDHQRGTYLEKIAKLTEDQQG